jgi:hypothetical protein
MYFTVKLPGSSRRAYTHIVGQGLLWEISMLYETELNRDITRKSPTSQIDLGLFSHI